MIIPRSQALNRYSRVSNKRTLRFFNFKNRFALWALIRYTVRLFFSSKNPELCADFFCFFKLMCTFLHFLFEVQPTYSFDSFMYLKSNVVTKKGLPVAVISSCALIHFWDFVSPLRLFLFNYYILYRSREHYFNRTIWHFKFTKSRLLLKTQSLIWNPLISRYLPITYASFQNNQSW